MPELVSHLTDQLPVPGTNRSGSGLEGDIVGSSQQWVDWLSRPIRERLKDTLDRRYITRLAIDPAAVDRFHNRAKEQHAEFVTRLEEIAAEVDTLRMRLNETHRLAIECSRSIESVLHNELLLWQAIDTLAEEQSGEPYPRS